VCRLTIVGGVREEWSVWRRGSQEKLWARGACPAWSSGPSTSPLDGMANALIIAFASLGLVGIFLGARAWRYASRCAAQASTAAPWMWLRIGAFLVGLALAIASLLLILRFSYPAPDGSGRIVGWPFFVAYFDPAGDDYVGWITYAGVLGNFVFWLLVPQFLLAAYARRRTRHAV
jgi:hypothetical protein